MQPRKCREMQSVTKKKMDSLAYGEVRRDQSSNCLHGKGKVFLGNSPTSEVKSPADDTTINHVLNITPQGHEACSQRLATGSQWQRKNRSFTVERTIATSYPNTHRDECQCPWAARNRESATSEQQQDWKTPAMASRGERTCDCMARQQKQEQASVTVLLRIDKYINSNNIHVDIQN